MPKTIPQLSDIGRAPALGDLFVVETPTGTKKMDADRVVGARLTKHLYASTSGGEMEIAIPGFEDSTFSVVFLGTTPLEQYNGALPVPGGMYKNDFAQSRILLGDAMFAGEKILILHY
jgi:hypothetical protein